MSRVARRNADSERQAKALEELKGRPGLFAEYEAIAALIGDQSRNNLKAFWQIGQRAKRIQSDSSFGDGAIDLLADACDKDASHLYRSIKFVEWIKTELELEELLSQENGSGQALTYTHVYPLLGVNEPEAREKLLQLTFDRNLSARELSAEIRKHAKPRATNRTGGVSRSVRQGIRRISLVSEKTTERFENFEKEVIKPLQSAEVDDVSESVLDEIIEAKNQTTALAAVVSQTLDNLVDAERRVRRLLSIESASVRTPPRPEAHVRPATDNGAEEPRGRGRPRGRKSKNKERRPMKV